MTQYYEHLFFHLIIDPKGYMAEWMAVEGNQMNRRLDRDDRCNHGEWHCPEIVCDDKVSRRTPLALLRHYLRKHAGNPSTQEDVERCVNVAMQLQRKKPLTVVLPNYTMKFKATYVLKSYADEEVSHRNAANNLEMEKHSKRMVTESASRQAQHIKKLVVVMQNQNFQIRDLEQQNTDLKNQINQARQHIANELSNKDAQFRKELDDITKLNLSATRVQREQTSEQIKKSNSIINAQALTITSLTETLKRKDEDLEGLKRVFQQDNKTLIDKSNKMTGYIKAFREWVSEANKEALASFDEGYTKSLQHQQ